MLDDGGQMLIAGTVGADVAVDFADGSGKLTIADAAGFRARLVSRTSAGDRIDLTGVLAQSERSMPACPDFSPARTEPARGRDLKAANGRSGNSQPHRSAVADGNFSLASDGNGGTLITYTPLGPTYLKPRHPRRSSRPPAPWSAHGDPDAVVRHYDTEPYGITLVAPDNLEKHTDGTRRLGQPDIPPAESIAPASYVNGQLLEQPSYTVQPNDVVELQVGNNISRSGADPGAADAGRHRPQRRVRHLRCVDGRPKRRGAGAGCRRAGRPIARRPTSSPPPAAGTRRFRTYRTPTSATGSPTTWRPPQARRCRCRTRCSSRG